MELYVTGVGQRIWTHDSDDCVGHACVIHSPSPHHMRGWATNYRRDAGYTERMCHHGVGHPDPDDMAFLTSVYEKKGKDHNHLGIHGCDGCCSPPKIVPVKEDLIRPKDALMAVLAMQD